jgi:glycine cleavage system H lipoate-binding protein
MELGYTTLAESINAVGGREEAAGLHDVSIEAQPRIGGVRVAEKMCIWMKAGIVNFHFCNNNYDCYHCPFDFSMRAAMAPEKQEEIPWPQIQSGEERIREQYGTVMHPCIHSLRGEVGAPPQCEHNLQCFQCPVHKDLAKRRVLEPTPLEGPTCSAACGYLIARGYYYHFGHSWVKVISGSCVSIGMDDFAAKVFGAGDALEIPPVGSTLEQGRVGWFLGRSGYRAPVQSPLSGKVLSLNKKVLTEPALAHDDPYGQGWLMQMEPMSLKRESEALFSDRESFRWMELENQALLKLIEPTYERLAATGGEPVDDLFGKLPQIGWDPLVTAFLRTGRID